MTFRCVINSYDKNPFNDSSAQWVSGDEQNNLNKIAWVAFTYYVMLETFFFEKSDKRALEGWLKSKFLKLLKTFKILKILIFN